MKVGIIGAGIAGLTLAHTLAEAGITVSVLDKGNRVGGRTSTRRTAEWGFDHGAQYFTVRDPRFYSFLRTHVPSSQISVWSAQFARLVGDKLVAEDAREDRQVGVPRMSSICEALATHVSVHSQVEIRKLILTQGGWILHDTKEHSHGPFDWVLMTAPPAQTAELLYGQTSIEDEIRGLCMNPCFSLLIAPSSDQIQFPADGIRCEHPILGWVSNNHSKPGRGPQSTLVIHSNHAWAEVHKQRTLLEVGHELKRAAVEAFEIDLTRPTYESIHRWLYAAPVEIPKKLYFMDPVARLGACGDWCCSGRVEGAFLSAIACAERLLVCSSETDSKSAKDLCSE